MTNMEQKIRDILQIDECTFDESIKRICALANQNACDAYCKVCDTKECYEEGTCDWVKRFLKAMNNK